MAIPMSLNTRRPTAFATGAGLPTPGIEYEVAMTKWVRKTRHRQNRCVSVCLRRDQRFWFRLDCRGGSSCN